MNQNNMINSLGVSSKLTPIISFNTIVDVDFGLANYIYDNYLDKSVFNEDFFKRNVKEIVSDLYLRKEYNPLYIFANDGVDHKLLDDYYEEFMSTKRKEIYEYSITTEILHLINTFNKNNGDITRPSILYFYPEDLEILNQEPILKSNSKIYIKDLREKDKNLFEQFFFKDWKEVEQYGTAFINKLYYISSCGINMNEDRSDLNNDILIKDIVKHRSAISIFDMYKSDITRKGSENNE